MQTAASIGFLSVHPHKDPHNAPENHLAWTYKTIQMSSLEDVAQVMISRVWASCLWRDGHLGNERFIEAWGIALDIDNGIPIEAASALLANFDHIIATTKSHRKLKDGVIGDRYRVYLPTFGPITEEKVYRETTRYWSATMKSVDKSKEGPGSRFRPGISLYEIVETGRRIEPKRPAERIRYFKSATTQPKEEKLIAAHKILIHPSKWGGRNNACYIAAHRLIEAELNQPQAVDFMRERTDLPVVEIEEITRKLWTTKR